MAPSGFLADWVIWDLALSRICAGTMVAATTVRMSVPENAELVDSVGGARVYLRTNEGWLYLCAVRDVCSRRVIGCAMDSAQTADLVE